MTQDTAIVWFQLDLRIHDNPALHNAIKRHERIIPVFICSPDDDSDWSPGAASKWWLHHSLLQLQDQLANLGSRLVIKESDPVDVLPTLAASTNATAVYWNARYEPPARQQLLQLREMLESHGIHSHITHGNLLLPPGSVQTGGGTPYKVFTPFWKRCLEQLDLSPPLPPPSSLNPVDPKITSLDVDALGLLPSVDWAQGIRDRWTPGEKAAQKKLDDFIEAHLVGYPDQRDIPSSPGTSRLSPHLHFGEISPRQIQFKLHAHLENTDVRVAEKADAFMRQIGWREFSYHLLDAFPETTTEPLNAKFNSFTWIDDEEALRKWQRGETGYPLVDAGMRELWATGWMHNRVRMLAASFLVKDLRIHWLEGARWFWDTLVDADLANNTMGWQWCAGTGADASPFFRIFNPVTQSKKFDKDGSYIRRWVPELANLTGSRIHEPWKLSSSELEKASATNQVYPERMVDHAEARIAALDEYKSL